MSTPTSLDRDLRELVAGRPIQVGPLTVTAPLSGGITLTDSRGGSSTFHTVEEFQAAVTTAKAHAARQDSGT